MRLKKLAALLLCVPFICSTIGADAMEIAAWTYRYGSYMDIVADGQDGLWIRDIMEWADFEKDENEIVIPESFRNRYKQLKADGKQIIMVLGYGNALYSGASNVTMPTVDNEAYFDAWLHYVRTMVTAFQDEVSHFEIWNEPNLEYANPNATAAQYAQLCIETKKAIEQTHRLGEDAVVIGGAFAYARGHSNFVRDFCNSGGSEMDGLSFHIYDYTYTPEGKWAPVLLEAFGNLMDELNYNKPLWFTETGYFTGTGADAVSEKTQASYMIRMQVLWDQFLKTRNREGKIFWFFTNDWGDDRSGISANHGLLNVNGTAKESFYTFKALNALIDGKEFVELSNSGGTYKALYKNPNSNDELYILWNSNNVESAQTVAFACDEVRVYDYKGELLQTVSGGSGSVEIRADGAPKFVECLHYGTTVEKLDYMPSKKVLKVSGICNFTDSVEIEIVKDGITLDKATAAVTDGRFEKELYTNAYGTCNVYAGRSAGDASYYGSAAFDFGQGSDNLTIENVTLAINDGNVSISGTVNGADDGECISIMVLPEGVNTGSVTAYNLAYIGETAVLESTFQHSFKMPEKSEGDYKIYLGGPSIANVFSDELQHGANDQLIGVCEISASKQDAVIVCAGLNNTSPAEQIANIIIAQYTASGRLKDVKIETVQVEAGSVLEKPYYAEAPIDKDASIVKAFILDGTNNIRPLAPAVYAE